MIGRVPRHRSYVDDVDPNATFVFIPGVLASGFLVSLAVLVGDAVRKIRGDAGGRRRVRLTSAALTEEIVIGAGASRSVSAGLRPRWVYGVAGAVTLGIGVAVAPGATLNFLQHGGYISGIGWIWALSLLGILLFLTVGVQIMRVAPEWVPIAVLLGALGLVARFAFGPESASTRYAVIVVSVGLGSAVTAFTWRLRRRRLVVDIPPSSRVLLAATPLGRVADD